MVGLSSKARKDRGQAIVIIALGFVILLGFAGLVVDVARVFLVRGQLRRAVDAGGLAASGQFRLGATLTNMTDAADQLIVSHGFFSPIGGNPVITATAITSLTVQTCENDPSEQTLHCLDLPRRKLVRVTATAQVPMIFLQLIGIPTVNITAQNMSEAAAVDAVLVLDASEAQAYDPGSAAAYLDKPTGQTPPSTPLSCNPGDVGVDNVNACIHACNSFNDCHPFQEVKAAAMAFVDKMYQDYDRLAVVSFNRNALVVHPLDTNLAQAKTDISDMQIPDYGGTACPFATGDDRWKCTSSNMGGGILAGSQQFNNGKRVGSLWTMILLGSGGADATDRQNSTDPDTKDFGFCPPRYDSTYPPGMVGSPPAPSKSDPAPLCRSRTFSTAFLPAHQPITTTGMVTVTYPVGFDAKDYAAMWGQYVGTNANADGTGGMGVLMFTIGLGKKVVCTAGTYDSNTGSCTTPWDDNFVDQMPGGSPGRGPLLSDGVSLPNGAELLLRYLAVSGNGSLPPNNSGCAGVPSGQQCDNYYFAPNAAGLNKIFLTIAGRIFTRITG